MSRLPWQVTGRHTFHIGSKVRTAPIAVAVKLPGVQAHVAPANSFSDDSRYTAYMSLTYPLSSKHERNRDNYRESVTVDTLEEGKAWVEANLERYIEEALDWSRTTRAERYQECRRQLTETLINIRMGLA